MQRVENDFAFVQNRWIADPCAVAINSLFISLFGTLEECMGKPVDNISLRKMDKSKRMWERHNWEQKPVMPIWELKMCYFASVPSIWKHSRRHKTENFTSRKISCSLFLLICANENLVNINTAAKPSSSSINWAELKHFTGSRCF